MASEKKSFTERAGRIILLLIVAALLASIMYYFEASDKKRSDIVWSRDYTHFFYQMIYKKFTVSSSDSSGVYLLSNCVVDKFKRKYPKGIDNLSKDSINAFYSEAAKECMKNIVIHFNWSARTDSSISAGLTKLLLSSDHIPKVAIKPMCNCYIAHLKKMYPKGLNDQVPNSIKDSLLFYCAKHLTDY